ncbi:uncharacterized protein [Ambystoma mexicanum]|uniref:uncharacterized protein isoform X2 n=1 Tax=Ambystoma mexicanum TaxID=8296 RepID=UPI0037E9C648
MSAKGPSLVPVTFHDVAVYFSEEEWEFLEDWQKDLYSSVMHEIHGVLISMGYAIVNPDTLFRIKKEEKPYISDHTPCKKRESFHDHASGSPVLCPDLLLRIKQEDEPVLYQPPGLKKRECILNPAPHHSTETSVISIRVKEEENDYMSGTQHSERTEHFSKPTNPVACSLQDQLYSFSAPHHRATNWTMSKARKTKFSDDELKVLVRGIVRVAPRLIGAQYQKTPKRQRSKLWQTIRSNVNAVATTPRSIAEIRKRWQDLRRRVRMLVALHRRETLATRSGSPPLPLELRPWEEEALTVIDLAGIDRVGCMETGAEGDQDDPIEDDDGKEEDATEWASQSGPSTGDEATAPPPTVSPSAPSTHPLPSTSQPLASQVHSDPTTISDTAIATVATPDLQQLRAEDILQVADLSENFIPPVEQSLPQPGRDFDPAPVRQECVPLEAQASPVSLPPSQPLLPTPQADTVARNIMDRVPDMEIERAQVEENGKELGATSVSMGHVLVQIHQSLELMQQEMRAANMLREEMLEEAREARKEAAEARQEAAAARADASAATAQTTADALAQTREAHEDARKQRREAREDAQLSREQASKHNAAIVLALRSTSASVRSMARSNLSLSRQMVEASLRHTRSHAALTGLLAFQDRSPMQEFVGQDGSIPSASIAKAQQSPVQLRCRFTNRNPETSFSPTKVKRQRKGT